MKKGGRPRTLNNPKELLDLWEEYKTHVDNNPHLIEKATNKGIQVESVKAPYLRQGFEAFAYRKLGKLVHQYLDNDGGNYEMFLGVVTCMRREWEEDQISGTLSGRYKAPNLTARLNGIRDSNDITTNGKDINLPEWMKTKKE